MLSTPHLIRDVQDSVLRGRRFQEWRINANVSCYLHFRRDEALIDLQLHFTHDADALLWEAKRVLPVMSQFGCTESGGLGWWGMCFPEDQTLAILTFLDQVTASREFYRW